MNTTTRRRFDAQWQPLHHVRPLRLESDDLVVDLWIGRRPRRSLRARLGWIWSRFNAAAWRDPFLMVVWIAVLLAGARMWGVL